MGQVGVAQTGMYSRHTNVLLLLFRLVVQVKNLRFRTCARSSQVAMSAFPHAIEVPAFVSRRPGTRRRASGFDDELSCSSVSLDSCVAGHDSPSSPVRPWPQQRGYHSGAFRYAGGASGKVSPAELGERKYLAIKVFLVLVQYSRWRSSS